MIQATPLAELLTEADPLAGIDPKDTGGALSPVSFVHLFRQYFFDLGSFLGEPVEHSWLAPNTTIELIETSSRRVLVEKSIEELIDSTFRTEQQSSVKDENQSSTKVGVSATASVTYLVFQGTTTATYGAESTRKQARESGHKSSREATEKVATDLMRSFKTSFKTITEASIRVAGDT